MDAELTRRASITAREFRPLSKRDDAGRRGEGLSSGGVGGVEEHAPAAVHPQRVGSAGAGTAAL